MSMTPVKDGEREPLEAYLHGLRAAGPSPFTKLTRTHIARFVIVPDFHNDRTWGQRKEEHLDRPYLIFTSNLDGDIDTYLNELCKQFAPIRQGDLGALHRLPRARRGPGAEEVPAAQPDQDAASSTRPTATRRSARSSARSPSASG